MHKTNCMQSIENISIGKYLVAYVLKNMPNAARIGHELTEIRDESPQFARFSLTIVIKKGPSMLQGHQFQNECSS